MPTALELIHTAAEALGRYDRRATTSAGTTTTLVCADYANSILSASEYANAYVLIESGACSGEVGQLTNNGLTRSTGTLTFATTFSSTIAAGVTFSLYSVDRLPPIRMGDHPGLMQIASQALERVWFEDTLSFLGVTNGIHYTIDTTTYSWFSDDTRIIDVQAPTTAADDVPRALSRSSWSWVSDGETRRLRLPGAPFRTGETFTVKVNRPGNSRLKLNARLRAVLTSTAVSSVAVVDGGSYTALPTIAPSSGSATFTAVMAATPGPITGVTVGAGGTYVAGSPPALTVTRNAADTGWADQATQTAGLATIGDECIPDVRFVRPMMLALGYQALAEMGAPGQTVAEWLAKADRWEKRAVALKKRRLPRDADDGVIRLRVGAAAGAGSRGGWGGY
jgi:hypothetical protein